MFAVAVVWVFAGDAVGEFVEMSFAGEDGAGGLEGVDEVAVVRRRGADFGEEGGAGEGGDVNNVEEIFEEIRDAGKRGGRGGVGEGVGELGFGREVGDDGALLRGRERADATVEFAGGFDGFEGLPVAESHRVIHACGGGGRQNPLSTPTECRRSRSHDEPRSEIG